MKILVIDDVDYIRKSISKVLDGNGFSCITAENGKQAIELLGNDKYDLIITDVMMPEMDGFEFLDYLRDQPGALGKTPVLAISGGSKTINPDLALKTIKEKANLILQKPFAKADLLAAVAKVVGNSRYSSVTAGD